MSMNYKGDIVDSNTGEVRRRDPVVDFTHEKSETKQAMKDACDINLIVKKALQTGFVSHVNTRVPRYGDYSNPTDYQQALDRVNLAEDQFMALPADLRERFSNDPLKFLEFVSDVKNKDKAIEYGLIPKPKEEEPKK